MELYDLVQQAQGGNAIANMARAFNLSPEQAEAAVKAVLPELARGIERNTLSRGGVADLVEALGNGQRARTIENPVMFGDQRVRDDGNDILKHILGPDKDSSRAAAQRASLSSGLGDRLIKMLLPYIAQMLMGALAKKTQGGLGDILSKIPGLPGNTAGGSGGMTFPQPQLPRQQPRSPTPMSPPSPRTINTPLGGSPSAGGRGGFDDQQTLPIPTNFPSDTGSGQNPYGDLSDIIRRGRGPGATVGGNPIWDIIRNTLGGALGFSTKGGVIGWVFRAIILRYGWTILRTILGGLFGRR